MRVSQLAQMNSIYRNIQVNRTGINQSLNRLSSGYRINSAADDAAGLAVSQKMRGQIGGLNMAYQNASHALNMTQTADGTLQQSNDIVTRMKELAVQASNGTISSDERAMINNEFQTMKDELDRTASATHYNGQKLLDGSLSDGVTFQIGANNGSDQRMSLSIEDMSSVGLGIADLDISSVSGANAALDALNDATTTLTGQRAVLGAAESRLESAMNTISKSSINLQQSESTIRDVDMAEEMINYTQRSIMNQASLAMMAQSMNMARSYALGLLLR